MSGQDPGQRARDLFVRDDNEYGCAEAALVTLQETFGFSEATDSSPAMALNGGIAYSGGMCGVISGSAIAIGRLAGERIDDHQVAKRTARRIIQRVITEFDKEFGSHDCRSLTGFDLSTEEGHDNFIASGVWRTGCAAQLEFSVGWLAKLADPEEWRRVVASLAA